MLICALKYLYLLSLSFFQDRLNEKRGREGKRVGTRISRNFNPKLSHQND